MPIYVYQCDKCNKSDDIEFKITDRPDFVPCKCGGVMKRVIAPSTFILKGGGWYKDGYRSKNVEKD